ncbi:hypothetical protein Landi51_07239 [Colletotrichum acutatum]
MERREVFQDAAANTKTVDAKTMTQEHVQRDEQSQRLVAHTKNIAIPGATAENEANTDCDALRGAPVFGRLEIEMAPLSEGRTRVGSDGPDGQSVIDHVAHDAFLLHGPHDQAHAMLDKILDNMIVGISVRDGEEYQR